MAKKPVTNKRNPWLKWILIGGGVLIVLAIIGGIFFNTPTQVTSETDLPLPAEIDVDKAYTLYNEGVFLLDVRTPEEWNEYHAPNTTLIPLDQLSSRLSEVPVDEPIVVVCRSGNRSQQGRDILKQAGYDQVTSMAGGLKAWQAKGYPVVSGP